MSKDRVLEGKKRQVADEVERAAKAILPNVKIPKEFFLLLERGGTKKEGSHELTRNCNDYLTARGKRKREIAEMKLLRSLLDALMSVLHAYADTSPRTQSGEERTRIDLAAEHIRDLTGRELNLALEQAQLPASKIRKIVEFVDKKGTVSVDLTGVVDEACRTGQRHALSELLAVKSIPSIEKLRRLVGQLDGVEIRDSDTKWKLVRRLKNLAAIAEAEFIYNGARVKSFSLNRSGRGFGNYDVRNDDGDQYRLSLFPPLGVEPMSSRLRGD